VSAYLMLQVDEIFLSHISVSLCGFPLGWFDFDRYSVVLVDGGSSEYSQYEISLCWTTKNGVDHVRTDVASSGFKWLTTVKCYSENIFVRSGPFNS
jgi:hypothetical protein